MKKAWIGFLLVAIAAFTFITLYSGLLNNPQTKEDKIATELLNNVLYDKYIPSHIRMVNKLTSENQTKGDDKLYGLIWYENDLMFYSSIFYNDMNKSGISDLKVLISTKNVPDNLNEESASLLFNQYFKVPSQDEIKCDYLILSNSTVNWCERFWEDSNNNKMGTVAVTSPNTKFIGFCEYPKGSIDYELSSCVQWKNE